MTRCGSWVILYAKRDNWLTVDPYALECKPRGSEPGGLLLLFIVMAMMELVDVEQGTKHGAACIMTAQISVIVQDMAFTSFSRDGRRSRSTPSEMMRDEPPNASVSHRRSIT